MRDVIELRIETSRLGAVVNPLEPFLHIFPRRRADVLEDNNGRAMFLHPLEHAIECTTGLSAFVDGLLLIVQVRVIYAGCACNKNVDVSGNRCEGTVCGMTMVRISDFNKTV